MIRPKIVDEEMRELFRAESEEHLQRLEQGLFRLEKAPDDRAVLNEVFREAHSLKGAARMLGLTAIEIVSHGMEDILGAIVRGEAMFCPATIDSMCRVLDGIRMMTREALTGEDAGISTVELMEKLRQGADTAASSGECPGTPGASRESGDDAEKKEMPAMAGAEATSPAEGKPEEEIAEFRIETMRVKAGDLDALLSHQSELAVARIRIARHVAGLDQAIGIWEEMRGKWQGAGTTNEFLGEKGDRLGRMLGLLRSAAYGNAEKLGYAVNALEEGIHSIRLLPFSTIFNLFPRMVRDMAREGSREVRLVIEGGDITSDKRIIEEMKDPLMHLLRNAVDHALEPPEEREQAGKPRCGAIVLKAFRSSAGIAIEVRDDGRGLDCERIRHTARKLKLFGDEELDDMEPERLRSLIFTPGFSTSSFVTETSGRGVGLDVVRDRVEHLRGAIHIESRPGEGCVFRIHLPHTLATARALCVLEQGVFYALPVEHVLTTRLVASDELCFVEGVESIDLDGRPVVAVKLAELLRMKQPKTRLPDDKFPSNGGGKSPCVVISVGGSELALFVDELLDEQEIVLKPPGTLLRRLHNLSGTVILGTGEVGIVLNPHNLVKSATQHRAGTIRERPPIEDERKKVILSVDDSVITRTQMKRILEGAGYEVVSAVDGVDACGKLASRQFDAVVSDVMMPNMDGLALSAKIREDRKYRELPVILVTALAEEEHRKRGIEAGANAYIAKPAFDQRAFLETLRRLV